MSYYRSLGDSPGMPVAKVMVQFGRFSAYTPHSGSMFWTVQETENSDNSESIEKASVTSNPSIGEASPEAHYTLRGNYLFGEDIPTETSIYDNGSTVDGSSLNDLPTEFANQITGKTYEQLQRIYVKLNYDYVGKNITPPKYSYSLNEDYSEAPKEANEKEKDVYQKIYQLVNDVVTLGQLRQVYSFIPGQSFIINVIVFRPQNRSENIRNFLEFNLFRIVNNGMDVVLRFINDQCFMMLVSGTDPLNYVIYYEQLLGPNFIPRPGTDISYEIKIVRDRIVIQIVGSDEYAFFPNATSEYFRDLNEHSFFYKNIDVNYYGISFGFNITSVEYSYENKENNTITDTQIQKLTKSKISMVTSPFVTYNPMEQVVDINPPQEITPVSPLRGVSLSSQSMMGIKVLQYSAMEMWYEMMRKGGSAWSNFDLPSKEDNMYNAGIKIIVVFVPVKLDGKLPPNYFGPKLYHISTSARCMPVFSTWIPLDISRNVLSIRYNFSHESYITIRKNYTVECLVPKPNSALAEGNSYTPIPRLGTTYYSWEKLSRNPCHVRIEMFHGSNRDPYPFVGVSHGGPLSYSNTQDILSLDCSDYISLLEQVFITNSPYFDGMAIPTAIGTLLERVGFSSLTKYGLFHHNYYYYDYPLMIHILPTTGLFTNPSVQFPNGKSILDCIREIVNRLFTRAVFTVETFAGGAKFCLRAQPGYYYSHTNVLPITSNLASDINGWNYFYSNKARYTNNIYNIMLDKKTNQVASKNSGQFNEFALETIDKYTGKLIQVVKHDYDSIMNPGSPNFIGHIKMYYSKKSALGGKRDAQNYLNNVYNVSSDPKTTVSFTAWGKNTIMPMDIIRVDNNNIRVSSVSGTLSRDNNGWKMNVSGENYGDWIPEDTVSY